jgi:3-deoxy-D-manno-octulosonic-acid transferase
MHAVPTKQRSTSPRLASVRAVVLATVLDLLYMLLGCVVFAVALVRGRAQNAIDHLRRRAMGKLPARTSTAPCIWIHGVSVGEVLTVRQLVARLELALPGWELAVSASTRGGVDAARQHFPRHLVFSCPLDLSWLVKRTFRSLRPNLLVIVEHDLWPNLLGAAARFRVPVVLANARLSPRSLRGYRRLCRWTRWPLSRLAAVCVQDRASAEGFHELGCAAERIHWTGNLKFDNPPPLAEGLRAEIGFEAQDWVFLAASTHAGEEEPVLDAFLSLRGQCPRSSLILVPRRPERAAEVSALVEARGLTTALWSRSRRRGPDAIVVDTVGELAKLSSVADAVFVGGSLVPVGGHNVIEPAACGRPIIIGPQYHNFRSVVQSFLEHEALLVVKDGEELASAVLGLWRDPSRALDIGERGRRTVEENLGAAERTIAVIRGQLGIQRELSAVSCQLSASEEEKKEAKKSEACP